MAVLIRALEIEVQATISTIGHKSSPQTRVARELSCIYINLSFTDYPEKGLCHRRFKKIFYQVGEIFEITTYKEN